MKIHFCSHHQSAQRQTLNKSAETLRFGHSTESSSKNTHTAQSTHLIATSLVYSACLTGIGVLLKHCYPSIETKLTGFAVGGLGIGALFSYLQGHQAESKQ